ncbi:hypothetical protein B0J17DRAFT_722750 [Rhizoctonia solani]|nr:hypothetical protein B0J17DRAFT_722750 [Rhizoctonia solani]
MSPRKASELTEAQRGMILGLRKAGRSYGAIAKEMKGICKISPSTAYQTCQRFKKHSTTKSLSGCGRCPVLSERMKCLIIQHVRIDCYLPYSVIANELGGVSAAQVQAVASAARYHWCVAVCKPFISKSVRQKRIQWAEENKEQDWDEAMWTDKMKMETGSTSTRRRVTRRPKEKDSLKCIAPTFQSGWELFMVWGCIAHNCKGPLVRLEMSARTVNNRGKVVGGGFGSAGYVEQIISGPLKDSVAELSKLRGLKVLVVEDGAPAHRGKRVDDA